MSVFYGRRFLSVLMGALTVLGSSVASAGKKRLGRDTKVSSARRARKKIGEGNGKGRKRRRLKTDRKVKGVGGLRSVLSATNGKVVSVSSDGEGGSLVFVKTPAGIVTVSVVGASLLALISYLTYSAFSGGEKTDGGGQSPNQDNGNQDNGNQDNGNQDNGNQDNGNQDNGNQDNGNQDNGNQDNGDPKPKEGPEVVNYEVMSGLLSGKKMEEYFLDCLFGGVFSLSLRSDFGNSFDGKVDKSLVDLVADGFKSDTEGRVIIRVRDKFNTFSEVKSGTTWVESSASVFYLSEVADYNVVYVSQWLSEFIANKGIINKGNVLGKQMLERTRPNFLKLIFLTCWYYALAISNKSKNSFSVDGLNYYMSNKGENMKKKLSEAWDAISKYVDYLFEEAEKKKKV